MEGPKRRGSDIRVHSVYVAQLTVDVLEDLRVGLVFWSVAAQRALRKKTERSQKSLWEAEC